MVPGLGEGTSDSTSWTPCYWGDKRMTPSPSRCLCSLRAATLCCTNPRARPLLCTYRHRRGLRGGAASSPALPFTFFLHLEERTVFDSALFMFLLGNKRWLCACVFSCVGFFKEMGRKNSFSLLSSPSLLSFRHPYSRPFFFPVLFCYESTFLFVILGSPGFLFSVKSPYASSALRLLFPRSGPYGLGGAWPVPLSRLIPSSLRPSAEEGEWEREWEREREREGERASGTLRSSDGRRAPSRRFWALGRLMSGLGGGRWRLQPAFGISEPRVSLWGGVTAGCKGDCPRPRQERKGRNFQLPAPLSL